MALSPEVATSVKIGIECCRRGDWNAGLQYLGKVTQAEDANSNLPGLFYSYLGYGIALRDKRIREGLKLCRHAIEVELFEPENYLNLARTCLLARDRRGAVKAVRAGLKVDRHNPKLVALYKEMGIRGLPVLSFLHRSNPLNVLLGRIRHALRGGS
ncbi:MAG: tetratricopeptide repeat protein [Thermoanaerobaculia bacterium]